MDDLKQKFSIAFEEWFKTSTVDFWNETDAADALGRVAAEIVRQELLPKLRVAAEALAVLEHHVQPEQPRCRGCSQLHLARLTR